MIPQREIGMAFGKGGMGYTCGLLRDGRHRLRVQGHHGGPSVSGVETCQASAPRLCHSDSPGVCLSIGVRGLSIFYYGNYFCSKKKEKDIMRSMPHHLLPLCWQPRGGLTFLRSSQTILGVDQQYPGGYWAWKALNAQPSTSSAAD